MQLRLLTFLFTLHLVKGRQPNILLFLTDDQDVFLDGMTPLTKTRELLKEQGTTFTNAFVTTPLCCPSRASLLTGKYLHNTGTLNNSIAGNCGGQSWIDNQESNTFATALHSAGYKTMYAGKYMNQYGTKGAGGVQQVPQGWDDWNGLVGNSVYYNYTLSANGVSEVHGSNYEEDYLTDVIGRKAESFLQAWDKSSPFLMVLGTPASHAPFTPAPQYAEMYSDMKAPRIPSYNAYPGSSKHWIMRMPPQNLSEESRGHIDNVFRNRWRTLLSVDDLISKTLQQLEDLGELDNTYIVYMSDHGYHMGEFTLNIEKRQPYEFDIRVPLIIRGPNVAKNVTSERPALQIDIAPTFLEIAGLDSMIMDGVPLVKGPEISQRRFLVEYTGEGGEGVSDACSQWNTGDFSYCLPEFDCKCHDTKNNTYTCLRRIESDRNTMFCSFEDDENFEEYYDLDIDPYQLDNLAPALHDDIQEDRDLLADLRQCSGVACHEYAAHTIVDADQDNLDIRPVISGI